jgi:hypothetical protein
VVNLAIRQGCLEFLDAGICDLGVGEYQPFKIGLPKGVGDPKKTDQLIQERTSRKHL